MKKITLMCLMLTFTWFSYAQVGLNTITPDASSALDIESTTGGILIPRLTQSQRDAISLPATGLMIFQTDEISGFYFYNSTVWTKIDGVAGPQGEQGPQGNTGAVGEQGEQGIQGPIGLTGLTGPSGQDGANGIAGPQGEIGATGVAGPTGPPGSQGAPGNDGITGTNGVDGTDGLSAYEIWVEAGNTGSEADFLASLVGPQSPGSTLEEVLTAGNTANNQQIKDLLDPTDVQDAVTLSVLLEKIEELKDQINSATGIEVFFDQDGNRNPYRSYGSQDWAITNAQVQTYRDGTPIPEVSDATQWTNLTTGAWCYYDNDPSKEKLYNFYAIQGIHDNDPTTSNKEFAPEGWHVPTRSDFYDFIDLLIEFGYNYDGDTTDAQGAGGQNNKLAVALSSKTVWDLYSPTHGDGERLIGVIGSYPFTQNTSGFNGKPSGSRYIYHPSSPDIVSFYGEGEFLNLWCSDCDALDGGGTDPDLARVRTLDQSGWAIHGLYENPWIGDKFNGMSVRFMRD